MFRKSKILFTSLFFVSTFIGIFYFIYKEDSKLKGFNRFRVTFKLAVIITYALIKASLVNAEELNLNPNPTSIEQIILVKDSPNSGELGKFGPGAKAQGRAHTATPAKVIGKGGSVFAEGFTPQLPYRHRQVPRVKEPLAVTSSE